MKNRRHINKYIGPQEWGKKSVEVRLKFYLESVEKLDSKDRGAAYRYPMEGNSAMALAKVASGPFFSSERGLNFFWSDSWGNIRSKGAVEHSLSREVLEKSRELSGAGEEVIFFDSEVRNTKALVAGLFWEGVCLGAVWGLSIGRQNRLRVIGNISPNGLP